MIAKNYMKHPEALRFQRELFSNGFHNSPRIMRLMECIFDWTPVAPGWWTAAKAKARALAKAVKKSICDLFKASQARALAQTPRTTKAAKTLDELMAGVDGVTANHCGKLFDGGVTDIDDLADMAPDELTDITGLTTDQACALLREARAHWFTSDQI